MAHLHRSLVFVFVSHSLFAGLDHQPVQPPLRGLFQNTTSNSTSTLNVSMDHTDSPQRPVEGAAASKEEIDQAWMRVLNNHELSLERPDQAKRRLEHWRKLASEAGKSDAALATFYSELAAWLATMKSEQRLKVVPLLEKENFSGSAVDVLIRSALKSIMTSPTEAEKQASPQSTTHRGAALAAVKNVKTYNANWNKTLDEVVELKDGKYQVNSKKQITSYDRNGKIKQLTGEQWVEEQIKELGFDNLARWSASVQGDGGNKTLAMLASYKQQAGKTGGLKLAARENLTLATANGEQTVKQGEAGFLAFPESQNEEAPSEVMTRYLPRSSKAWQNVQFQPTHGDNDTAITPFSPPARKPAAKEEHSHGGTNTVSPARHLDPSGRTVRQVAIEEPKLQPILDKCIACHVMNPATSHVATLPQLKEAMRHGEYGTFQRKIMGMMGAKADAVHIHFTPEELAEVARVYRTKTNDHDDASLPPKAPVEIVSAQEKKFSAHSPRGKAIQNPVVTAALYRCLVCHKDPASQGNTGEVNTISKLRAAMHTIDETTLSNMIKRGYSHDRMIHIQDLKDGTNLEQVLIDIAKMPADQEGGIR